MSEEDNNYNLTKEEAHAIAQNWIKQDLLKEGILKWEEGLNEEQLRILLGSNYDLIIETLKLYLDMPEEYYNIIALWVIGTYIYKNFSAFPYLFFNAMRGSGKSRVLKLITSLAWEGKLLASLTEAVMFRMNGTLAIDEFEGLGSKEKQSLRELLNASYKKGVTIQRMKKKKTSEGEQQIVEEFEPYKPIIMANIWGMDEVLGDRCIILVLEKSNCSKFTKLIEDFEANSLINSIKTSLNGLQVGLLGSVSGKKTIYEWNNWVKQRYSIENTTNIYNPYNLPYTTNALQNDLNSIEKVKNNEFFLKIDETELNGRDLELFFPLFTIANFLNEEVLNKTLEFSKSLIKSKRIEEQSESKDVLLYSFISEQQVNDYHKVKELTIKFRAYLGEEEREEGWLNPKWFGRALKRLNLIVDKRQVHGYAEVTLNVEKAKKQSLIFKAKT